MLRAWLLWAIRFSSPPSLARPHPTPPSPTRPETTAATAAGAEAGAAEVFVSRNYSKSRRETNGKCQFQKTLDFLQNATNAIIHPNELKLRRPAVKLAGHICPNFVHLAEKGLMNRPLCSKKAEANYSA